ncbi:MAG: hypothetical protein N2049_09110, partial [Anaerolineales bacterium]|nr:hypothetical protein [Anaerolineales bacterium]
PASSYDSDDNNASHFIIASPLSDPGLVSAPALAFGSGSASSRNWRNTSSSNSIQISASDFISYLRSRTLIQTAQNLEEISQNNLNRQPALFSDNLTSDDSHKTLFDNLSLVLYKGRLRVLTALIEFRFRHESGQGAAP